MRLCSEVALEEKALRVILDVVSGSTQAIVALALLGAIPLVGPTTLCTVYENSHPSE
jgi:hypothetical protein